MLEPKMTNIRQQVFVGPNNLPVSKYIVTFNVGSFGPFIVEVPAEEFTPELVRKKQLEVAETVSAIAGSA